MVLGWIRKRKKDFVSAFDLSQSESNIVLSLLFLLTPFFFFFSIKSWVKRKVKSREYFIIILFQEEKRNRVSERLTGWKTYPSVGVCVCVHDINIYKKKEWICWSDNNRFHCCCASGSGSASACCQWWWYCAQSETWLCLPSSSSSSSYSFF